MAGEYFVQFGTGGYSEDDLNDFAKQDIAAETPQFFHFLMAVETIRMLRAISNQLDDLHSLLDSHLSQ